MSTYWYFECLNHTPPLQSAEFTQHTGDRHYDRGIQLAANRPVEKDDSYWTLDATSDEERSDAYFDMHARAFLSEHPSCRIGVVSEYGERAPDIAETTSAPFSFAAPAGDAAISATNGGGDV